jgi:hypothetical protein
MMDFFSQITKSLFDIKNLWLILICALALMFFKIFEISYQIWNFKKMKKNIIDYIDKKYNYRKILNKTENLLSQGLIEKDIYKYEIQISGEIKDLNKDLDNIWIEHIDKYSEKSGLSRKAADIIITSIIRKITFQYWQISDVLMLADPSQTNKVEILNNLFEYANKDIFKFLHFLQMDDKYLKDLGETTKKYLNKQKTENRIISKEEKILLKELCSLN